jgi:hypothetical protein
MIKSTRVLFLSIAIFSAFIGACSGGEAPPSPAAADYEPVATVRDLMQSVLDPSSDAIWQSVATTVTGSGLEERRPKTDEEWTVLRGHALRLMEVSNLLQMPGRRVARPGEKSSYPGIELGPEEIQAEIDKDLPGWIARARGLREAVMPTLEAIEAKDPKRLEEVGDRIDAACENCHLEYWYPNSPGPPPEFPKDAPTIGQPQGK